MKVVILLFLAAVVGTMWGRGRFLKIYAQERDHLISSRATGAELAEAMLRRSGVPGVGVTRSQGLLPDFYHPESRRITLSPQHFASSSYSALALAALQVGKAIQHHEGHRPLLWRTGAVRWSAWIAPPLALVGAIALVLGGKATLPAVVLLWTAITFWNLLTVPTEVDAALRAKRVLEDLRVFRNLDERVGVERVMGAASTAYIDGFSILGSWIARKFLRRAPNS